ncbi:hypothetical protein NA57DRAFT_28225, partial [Rhizodiscina lignyota]
MASKKDMRNPNLIVPFVEPEKKENDADMSSAYHRSTFPCFTAQHLLFMTAVMFSVQSWLAETPEQKKNTSTPGYFSVGMASQSYMPLFMPPPPNLRAGSGTGAPSPVP